MSYAMSTRKSNAKLAVVQTQAEVEKPEGELGDGDDDYYEIENEVAIRVVCVECATSCLSSDPTLGDPIALARRMYEFVLEG